MTQPRQASAPLPGRARRRVPAVRAPSWLRMICVMALLGLPAGGLAGGQAAGAELLVFRTAFQNQEGRQTVELKPEQDVEVRDEFWRVRGASRFRVESPNPEALVVMRFRAVDERSGALALIVTFKSQRGTFDYSYPGHSEIISGGVISQRDGNRIGDGLVTDLSGTRGDVVEIRIRDDATAELRLSIFEGELLLDTIPAAEGGELSGRAFPIFRGQTLELFDYTLLGGGYTDNGYAEVLLSGNFALKLNGLVDGDNSAAAVRLVVRQQLWRSRTLAFWLEGGGGVFTQEPSDPSEEKEGEPTPVFGATGIYRSGDWSASLHAAWLNGPTLTMVMGGWRFSKSFSVFLEWQSLLGFSGQGLGLAIGF